MDERFQTRHVLFDGGCGFCSRAMRVLGALDWMGKTVKHDVAHDWDAIQKRFPNLSFEQCMLDMHVVTTNGQTTRGFDAYRSLAWVLPLGWIVLPLLYLPPIRWLGWKIYRRIADHRQCLLPE